MKRLPAVFLFTFVVFLSACESAPERAEKYFQSAMELLEAGDEPRAIVELKNALKLNAIHREARTLFAEIKRNSGDAIGAADQYRRLVEQYPDDFSGQLALAEIYSETGNWDQMEQFVVAANALMPGDLRAIAVQLVLDYRNSVEAGDAGKTENLVESVQDLTVELPNHLLLRRVLVDHFFRQENYAAARDEVDAALRISPEDRELYAMRLAVLAALEDPFAIEKQLRRMVQKFPDDPATRTDLVQWLISQGQTSGAEEFLRQAAQGSNGTTEAKLALVRFVSQLRGSESALLELDQFIAAGDTSILLQGLRAGIDFDLGNEQDAIGKMRELLAGSDPLDDQQKIKLALAEMLITRGNLAPASVLVDDILAQDPSNVAALKRKAEMQISDDQTAAATLTLKSALEISPDDAEILTGLARAYERDGKIELVGEMLSLAASYGGSAQAIRYAKFLRSQGSLEGAEPILVDALRIDPENISILEELGDLYVAAEDWPRAEQVRATLSRVGSLSAETMANELQAQILLGQQKTPEAIEFLEELSDQGDAGISVDIAIVRNHLVNGDQGAARRYLNKLIAADPENPEIRFLDASMDVAADDLKSALPKFRNLVDQDNNHVQAWVALFRIHTSSGQPEEANDIIKEARQAVPDDPTLMWIDAGLLEAAGEMEAAIAIYEQMYARDSENLVIANNLASLLSTVRSDAESLAKASTISRRLKSSQFAPYQDTYGWILYLNGDFSGAVRALETAANGMASDATVQYHLARAYLAINNDQDALARFQQVVELTDGADSREFVKTSRLEVIRLVEKRAARR